MLARVRLLGIGLTRAATRVRSRIGWQVWATERLLDMARNLLFPLYASLLHAGLAAAARRQGRPRRRGLDGAAAAEDDHGRRRRVPRRRHDGRLLRARRRLDAHRPGQGRQARVPRQLGMAGAGPRGAQERPGRGAVGDARRRRRPARPGSAARRCGCAATAGDRRRAPHLPPAGAAEARPRRLWSCAGSCRWSSPWPSRSACSSVLDCLVDRLRLRWPRRCSRAVVLLRRRPWPRPQRPSAAKWLLVGRHPRGEHPLWSSFVWRNEVADTFVEMVARPWFAQAAAGTPALDCVAALARRQDRPRGVVRDLLAARGRPGRPSATAPP